MTVPTWRALAAVLAVAACGAGVVGWLVSRPRAWDAETGHREMLAILASVAQHSPELDSARAARAQLTALPESAPALLRVAALMEAARWEMWLGEEAVTIEHIEAMRTLLEAESATADVKDTLDYVLYRLGIAHMRLGETQNCCQRNTPDSCIVPIRGGGLHTRPEGSTRAMEAFTELLGRTREGSALQFKARWLLNIAAMTLGVHPEGVPEKHRIAPEVFASAAEFPRFTNVAPERGLDTFDMCGGAVADDFTGDGVLDILTSSWDRRGPMHFFVGLGGGEFADRTEEAGLTGFTGGLNMVQADYDGDGNLDVLVLRGAWRGADGCTPSSLLRNTGGGHFIDATLAAGLGGPAFPTQTAAWGDLDLDGDLDLYLGQEHTAELLAPCRLLRNEGDGTFTDVAALAGVENLRFTKGVVWGDVDGDRYPDLYVSNLTEPNRLYRNDRDGTFTDVAVDLGVDRPINSFPVWFWDYDNDGKLDLYVSSYHGVSVPDSLGYLAMSWQGEPALLELAHLYRGDGSGGFEDVGERCGLERLTMPMGASFGDVDGDGWLDFYLGTGFDDYEALMPNVLYHSERGERFVDVSAAAGLSHLQKGHAVVFADLDDDGDVDIFEQMGGAQEGDRFGNALYQNPGFDNRWIDVELVGVHSNRSAIGARIRVVVVEDGEERSIYRHVCSGGSFGASPLRQHIGLGRADHIKRLEVYWPVTDETQTFTDVAPGQRLRILEGEATPSAR